MKLWGIVKWIWKKTKTILLVLFMLVIMFLLVERGCKPSPPPPETVTVVCTLSLGDYLKDSLTNEIKNRFLRIVHLEGVVNELLGKLKEKKADTVQIGVIQEKFSLKWEWIAHVKKTGKGLIVVTFRIDSLVKQEDIAKLEEMVDAGKVVGDSVIGRTRVYTYLFKEDDFVLTSRGEEPFLAIQRQTPFSGFLWVGFGYSIIDNQFQSPDNWGSMDRFKFRAGFELYIKDRIRLGPHIDNQEGIWVGSDYALWRFGRMKQ